MDSWNSLDLGGGEIRTPYGGECYAHGPDQRCGGYHLIDEREEREIRDHVRDWGRSFATEFERLSGGVPVEAWHGYGMRLDLDMRRMRDDDFALSTDAAAAVWARVEHLPPGRTNVRPQRQQAGAR